jgi:hypothetical protein
VSESPVGNSDWRLSASRLAFVEEGGVGHSPSRHRPAQRTGSVPALKKQLSSPAVLSCVRPAQPAGKPGGVVPECSDWRTSLNAQRQLAWSETRDAIQKCGPASTTFLGNDEDGHHRPDEKGKSNISIDLAGPGVGRFLELRIRKAAAQISSIHPHLSATARESENENETKLPWYLCTFVRNALQQGTCR